MLSLVVMFMMRDTEDAHEDIAIEEAARRDGESRPTEDAVK